jgi:ABC-type glutathione transport system ATPase component
VKPANLLNVQNLCVTYHPPGRQPVEAVRGVSFAVQAGESLGIVGESGCGKTSLAKAIMGLHPPSAGSLRFGGREIGELDATAFNAYRRAVQMVFQDAVGSLNPRLSVRQTLEEVLRVHRMVPRVRVGTRVRELLERVGLPENVLDAYPRELSGGQCQRVSFARSLALEPALILADEPVSALDVSVQARILNLIRTLQTQLGLAVILISHDLAVVRNICDRVAVMFEGQFVEYGLADDVLDRPKHAYTRALLAAVPDVGRALAKGRPAREDAPSRIPNR